MGLLDDVLRRVASGAEFARLAAEVAGGARVVSVAGLTSSPARALVLAALQRVTGRRFAVVAQSNLDAEGWERDLKFWSGAAEENEGTLVLPASEGDPYAGASPHVETLERRALTFWQLARGRGGFVVLSARALMRRTVEPATLLASGAVLRRDEDHPPEELLEKLFATGYVREDPVGAVGEFSLRGGILDVWSPGTDAPVRVEFFGDTVDSIRKFDPETQLSIAQLQEAEVVPMREYAVSSGDFRLWAEAARERWGSHGRFAHAVKDRTAHAEDGEDFAGWEWLIPLLISTNASALDYLPADTVLVVDEPAGVEQSLVSTYDTLATRYAEADAADEIGLQPDELYLTVEELRAKIEARQRVEFRALGREAALIDERFAGEVEQPAAKIGKARAHGGPLFLFPVAERASEVELRSLPVRRYHGRVPDLAADVRRRAAQEAAPAATLFVLPSVGMAERVGEVLADYEVGARVVLGAEVAGLEGAHAVVTAGRLSSGFELPEARLVVHVETDLFDEAGDHGVERRAPGGAERQKAKGQKQKSKTAAFLSDFRDLKVGDFVVHIDHGIARFGGLQTLDLGANRRGEFMLLFYAEDSKLFVPVERMDLVQRYSSAEGTSRSSTSSAAWAGKRRRPRPSAPCATWPTSCSSSTPKENSWAATPSPPTARGSASSRTVSVPADGRSGDGHRRREARHGAGDADGPPALRRRGLRQDRGGDARRF
jgi:transcription-repair coupling factor (superfamily II helicase)